MLMVFCTVGLRTSRCSAGKGVAVSSNIACIASSPSTPATIAEASSQTGFGSRRVASAAATTCPANCDLPLAAPASLRPHRRTGRTSTPPPSFVIFDPRFIYCFNFSIVILVKIGSYTVQTTSKTDDI